MIYLFFSTTFLLGPHPQSHYLMDDASDPPHLWLDDTKLCHHSSLHMMYTRSRRVYTYFDVRTLVSFLYRTLHLHVLLSFFYQALVHSLVALMPTYADLSRDSVNEDDRVYNCTYFSYNCL